MKQKYDRLYLVDNFEMLGFDNTKARRAADIVTGVREELEDMMTDIQRDISMQMRESNKSIAEAQRSLIDESRREFDQFSKSMEKRMQKDNRNTIISIILGCAAIAVSILIASFAK